MNRADLPTLASLLCFFLTGLPGGADSAASPVSPVVGKAARFDVSAPLREMARTYAIPTPDSTTAEVPQGFVDRARPTHGATVPDPVRQTLERPLGPGAMQTPQPDRNWHTLSDDDNQAVLGNRWVPPNTAGDVGTDHYFQWVDRVFAIYDKTDGSAIPTPVVGPVAGNSLFSGFGGPCETQNDGNPVVLYDQFSGQWQVSQFAIDEGTQCIAVSQTGDPAGSWYRYAFEVTPGGENQSPKLGVTPTGYTATFRDFQPSPSFHMSLAVFERDKMVVGDSTAAFVKFDLPCDADDCIDGVLPVEVDGDVPRNWQFEGAPVHTYWYLGANDEGIDSVGLDDSVRMWTIEVDWSDPAGAMMNERPRVQISSFDRDFEGCDFYQCVPQPAPGERLSALQFVTMPRAALRVFEGFETVVLSFVTDILGSMTPPQAGVRWVELRRDTVADGPWTLFQEGTYAPDQDWRWNSSIAMDKTGNIALGYNVSNATDLEPSIRYTSRQASEPPGLMPGGEEEGWTGTGVQTASANRWGDHASMTVDPEDECTFWFTTEYYETTGSFDFHTRTMSFVFENCQNTLFTANFESGSNDFWDIEVP